MPGSRTAGWVRRRPQDPRPPPARRARPRARPRPLSGSLPPVKRGQPGWSEIWSQAGRRRARRRTHIQVPPVLPQHAGCVLRVLLTRRVAKCLHHLKLLVAQALQRGHGGGAGQQVARAGPAVQLLTACVCVEGGPCGTLPLSPRPGRRPVLGKRSRGPPPHLSPPFGAHLQRWES